MNETRPSAWTGISKVPSKIEDLNRVRCSTDLDQCLSCFCVRQVLDKTIQLPPLLILVLKGFQTPLQRSGANQVSVRVGIGTGLGSGFTGGACRAFAIAPLLSLSTTVAGDRDGFASRDQRGLGRRSRSLNGGVWRPGGNGLRSSNRPH